MNPSEAIHDQRYVRDGNSYPACDVLLRETFRTERPDLTDHLVVQFSHPVSNANRVRAVPLLVVNVFKMRLPRQIRGTIVVAVAVLVSALFPWRTWPVKRRANETGNAPPEHFPGQTNVYVHPLIAAINTRP
jgi:hypothetical protein